VPIYLLARESVGPYGETGNHGYFYADEHGKCHIRIACLSFDWLPDLISTITHEVAHWQQHDEGEPLDEDDARARSEQLLARIYLKRSGA
jgi:hypothetical protein